MAPAKRPRENAPRNRDKTRRRKRARDVRPLFKFMGQLCGEECERDLLPASEGAGRGSARRDGGSGRARREALPDPEMDAIAEPSDEECDEAPLKPGRVGKAKPRKPGQSGQASDMPLKIGVQKAMRYICEALDFGVQSGYLTPKDSKGKVLRVSSDLFQAAEPARGRGLQRVASDGGAGRAERRQSRRQPSDSQASGAEPGERGHRRPRKPRSRSGSRQKRRSGKSRSRSRSKRRHGGKRAGSSRSGQPEAELRAKQMKPEQQPEQDDMDADNKESAGSRRGDDIDNEDGKSVKSAKSAKSTVNSDSQNTNEEKKHADADADADADDDAGSDEDDDEDEDEKKK